VPASWTVPLSADEALPAPPLSAPGSIFRRFCYRYGVVGNLCLGIGFLLPPLAITLGAAVGGLLGAAAGACLGLAGFWGLMNRLTVYGNGRLRSELARHLGADGREAVLHFVGLCLPENNTVQGKLLTMRLETDDNVGFLHLDEDGLSIVLEEGRLRIPRDQIREVRTERFVELPYLRWIVVEYYEDAALRTLLLCSRQCRSLREARAATDRLLRRVVDWYTEPVLRQLEASRWA
jgi:hypothetical protein